MSNLVIKQPDTTSLSEQELKFVAQYEAILNSVSPKTRAYLATPEGHAELAKMTIGLMNKN